MTFRGILTNSAIILGCVAFVLLLESASPAALPTSQPIVTVIVQEDIVDPKDSVVLAAAMEADLVQWGFTTPYTGNGIPGIILTVTGTKGALNWTIEAWANQTAPSPVSACKEAGIHFAPSDWIGVADDAQNGSVLYVTTPNSSPSRMEPGGDQCSARALAFGVWHVHVRIDHLDGGPRGLYDAQDGRRHYDSWDRRIDADFKVPA